MSERMVSSSGDEVGEKDGTGPMHNQYLSLQLLMQNKCIPNLRHTGEVANVRR